MLTASTRWRHYSAPSVMPIAPFLDLAQVPHVTIIRPVKGIEPYLYECLAATFHQQYPSAKLTIYFCISARSDPAFPILEKLLVDFTSFDVKILVEEEDPYLSGEDGQAYILGPNPKIRNMSRSYREAKGDIIWIIDCNVWISKTVAGLMVDHLCGFSATGGRRKYKFVHQLPLAVDVSTLLDTSSSDPQHRSLMSKPVVSWGGLLEELFLSTSHAKFYTAISTVGIAPCTVGKSNMFRRSHLNALTPPNPSQNYSPGIDHFSSNICEDHLIGDLLWKSSIPPSVQESAAREGQAIRRSETEAAIPATWRNHALLLTPPCIQPLAKHSIRSYCARRTRWLRVRKFTVPLATFVEPGTESLLATTLGIFGLTTASWCQNVLGIPHSWTAFTLLWILAFSSWCAVDFLVWQMLQSWKGEEVDRKDVLHDAGIPMFVGSGRNRKLQEWGKGWLGRELLAWPIWVWACLGGTEVVWRGRKLWVGMDMTVHEVAVDADEGCTVVDMTSGKERTE